MVDNLHYLRFVAFLFFFYKNSYIFNVQDRDWGGGEGRVSPAQSCCPVWRAWHCLGGGLPRGEAFGPRGACPTEDLAPAAASHLCQGLGREPGGLGSLAPAPGPCLPRLRRMSPS